MPTFYNYTENGVVYSVDDVFVSSDAFRRGNLFTWGRNNYAQLGTRDAANRLTPVTTFAGGANWKQLEQGGGHNAAVKTDGTLWTWGRNFDGALGVLSPSNASTPITTFAGGNDWKQVSCGSLYTAAVKSDGTLWVWGRNDNGQHGTGNLNSTTSPVTTFAGGTNWKQVSCGAQHTGAIKTDGTLWVWGRNDKGQLGTNLTIFRINTPVTTFAGGNDWRQVSCGFNHTGAIKTDGTLWMWGESINGALGDNDAFLPDQKSTPVTTFAGGTNWKQVFCGYNHTGAIKTDGTLWMWGKNTYGQLGNNIISNRSKPVTTFAGGTNWKQVACGTDHTGAIKTDGTLWMWGRGSYGRLGNNATANRSIPVTTFAGGTNWKQVSCGSEYSGAITYIDYYE